MTKKQKIIAGVGAIAVIAVIAGGIWIASANKASNKTASIDVAAITTFEQCNDAGFPTIKHYPDQCQTPDGRIFVNENPPSETELAQAEQTVRTFMGDQNLELVYITQNRHPNNFAVLSNVKPNAGGFTADNPEEWDRPVYIFQQTNPINDRCEVYEYQVTIKTHQVVEISIVYPRDVNSLAQEAMTPAERTSKCGQYGSLEVPLKTKAQIEQVAFAYLSRDPEHTKILSSEDVPEYSPSKTTAKNPAQNEWRWEDKNVSLPEGLTGDPWQHPLIRIIISSGGKLVYYLNTTDLFSQN